MVWDEAEYDVCVARIVINLKQQCVQSMIKRAQHIENEIE